MSTVSLAPYVPPTGASFRSVSNFTAPMQIEYDAAASHTLNEDVWRVTSAFKFYVGDLKDDTWVYIPAGYLTDGASVPRLFWDLIPPWGAYGQAAVVHDILCEYLTVFKGDGTPMPITRKHADNILKQALEALSVPGVTKWAIYSAVKLYTYVDEKLHGPTAPQAYAAKRQLEDTYVPSDDVVAETIDTTACPTPSTAP